MIRRILCAIGIHRGPVERRGRTCRGDGRHGFQLGSIVFLHCCKREVVHWGERYDF